MKEKYFLIKILKNAISTAKLTIEAPEHERN